MGQDGSVAEGKEYLYTPRFEVHVSPSTVSWGFMNVDDGYMLLGMLRSLEGQITNRLNQIVMRAQAEMAAGAVSAPEKVPGRLKSVPGGESR